MKDIRRMRKGLFLLIVCLLLCTTGCSGSQKEASIVGDWRMRYDLTDTFREQLGSYFEGAVDVSQYFNDITCDCILSFGKDHIYSSRIAEDSVADMTEKIKEGLKLTLQDYFLALLADAGVDTAGREPADVILENMGLSLDDVVATMDESLDFSALYAGDTAVGQYWLEEGKLFLSDDVTKDPGQDIYMEVEVGKKEITVTNVVGTDELIANAGLPFTMTKE